MAAAWVGMRLDRGWGFVRYFGYEFDSGDTGADGSLSNASGAGVCGMLSLSVID